MMMTMGNFEETDKLDVKGFAGEMERFLATERDFVDGGLVISLNAPFGSGKTTFLGMWKHDLEKRRTNDSTVPLPIVLNAWESDHCGDPLLAIVSALTQAVKGEGASKAEVSKLREAAKDVAWMGLGLANSFVASATGLNAMEAGQLASEKKAAKGPPDLLLVYEARVAALAALKESLSKVFAKVPGYIFVDELDRCRPDYAVTYLETIKHVFDLPQLVFVLAVDKVQLQTSVQALYGDLDFKEYYRKFVHRNIELPLIDEKRSEKLLAHFSERYLTGAKGRRLMVKEMDILRRHLRDLAIGLDMTPRQIQEVFRIVGHTTALKGEKQIHLHWGYPAVTVLLAALAVADPIFYRKVGKRKATFVQICEYLKERIGSRRNFQWWAQLLASTDPLAEDSTAMLDAWRRLGLATEATNPAQVSVKLEEMSQAWGMREEDAIPYVYGLIEDVKAFAS